MSEDADHDGDEKSDYSSMLSDYYGFALESALEQGIPATAPPPSEQKISLSSRKASIEEQDIDSAHFNSDLYVRGLLRDHGIKELLDMKTKMTASKSTLDSDMQMLVYENYNKFISATDMIRKMKDNVESMEEEMKNLLTNMNTISGACETLETELSPSRSKVENLVGTSRLLKRLEFLFELPGRLNKSIQLRAHSQAVKYWRVSNHILKQYKHLPSFEKIRSESEGIVHGLKLTLRQIVKDASSKPDVQMENAALLIDLSEPADVLLRDVFATRKEALKKELMNAVNLAYEQAKKQSEKKLKKQDSKKELDEDGKEAPSPSALLALLRSHFLDSFVFFADSFNHTFIKVQEQRQLKRMRKEEEALSEETSYGIPGVKSTSITAPPPKITKTTPPTTSSILEQCRQALTGMTSEVFSEYFAVARKQLLLQAGQATNETGVQQLTALLKSFYEGLVQPSNLVPQANLGQKGVEIIEHTIRQCAQHIFDQTMGEIVKSLKTLQLQAFESKVGEKAKLKTPSEEEPKEETSTRSELFGESKKSGKVSGTKAIASEIGRSVDQSLTLLAPLLLTNKYLPNNLGLDFSDFPHEHLRKLLNSVNDIAQCGILRDSEGPVWEVPSPSPLTINPPGHQELKDDESPASNAILQPPFYLYLSQICLAFEKTQIQSCVKHLKSIYHQGTTVAKAKTKQKSQPQGWSLFEADLPLLGSRFRESAQGLLLRYVEVYGFRLTAHVRALQSSNTKTPTSCSRFVTIFLQEIAHIEAELTQLFPGTSGEGKGSEPSKSRRSGRDSPVSTSSTSSSHSLSHVSQSTDRGRRNTRGGKRDQASGRMDKDIERLFSEKVRIFGPVKFNALSPLVAILRVGFKALVEITRTRWLSKYDLQQLQLDIFSVRSRLFGSQLMSPSTPSHQPHSIVLSRINSNDLKNLTNLLDEVISSGEGRCSDNDVLLSVSTLQMIYQRQTLPSASAPSSSVSPEGEEMSEYDE